MIAGEESGSLDGDTVADVSVITVTGSAIEATDTKYDLWVGDVQVTSANKDNITGAGISGTITYDPDTATLTLDGAEISGVYTDINDNVYGIYTKGNLNLVLENNNSSIGVESLHTGYGVSQTPKKSIGVKGE